MTKRRIVLLENIHPDAKTNLEAEGFEVTLLPKALGPDELVKTLQGVTALGIRSKTQITADVVAQLPDLEAIGTFCIGTNQVALEKANQLGVPVFNAPFSNTRSVAEMVIGEIIFLARRLSDRAREMHQGVWTKSASGSMEIRNKTLGIVGYGHIGRQVGVLAEAFGMKVIFFDVASRLPMGNNRNAESLNDLLRHADFVTLHVPETPQTKNMFGKNQIDAMKEGAYLINASRGTVVVIDELAAALKSEKIAGAAIDVFPDEPEGNDGKFVSALQNLPNVILTPHIGGSTAEAQVAIGHEVSTALARYFRAGNTIGAVNFPQADLPTRTGAHRIAHVHRNVPGVLRDVNRIVSEAEANVVGQVLATDSAIGYLIMDIEDERGDIARALPARMRKLATTIRASYIQP